MFNTYNFKSIVIEVIVNSSKYIVITTIVLASLVSITALLIIDYTINY